MAAAHRMRSTGDSVYAGLRILGKTHHHRVGWSGDIARAWVELMKRLGYTSFVAQGGDWGAVVTEQMGLQAPPEDCSPFTPTCPGCFRTTLTTQLFPGRRLPAGLSADEKHAYEQLSAFYRDVYYALFMGTRPHSQFGFIWVLLAAPLAVAVRDLYRYAYGRVSDPPRPAGLLPGELPPLQRPNQPYRLR